MPRSLTVMQPSILKNSYLLLDKETLVGRLDRTGIFRHKIIASIDGHSWRFVKKSSLRQTLVTVMPLDNDEPVAVYRRPGLRQTGSVTLNDTEYRLKVSAWKSRYTWSDKDDNPLATYTLGGFFKRSGTIEIADPLLIISNYELLLPLGLYLGMEVEDSNSSVAVTAGS